MLYHVVIYQASKKRKHDSEVIHEVKKLGLLIERKFAEKKSVSVSGIVKDNLGIRDEPCLVECQKSCTCPNFSWDYRNENQQKEGYMDYIGKHFPKSREVLYFST